MCCIKKPKCHSCIGIFCNVQQIVFETTAPQVLRYSLFTDQVVLTKQSTGGGEEDIEQTTEGERCSSSKSVIHR